MHYTQTESRYFYFHCRAAALVLQDLGLNTATRVHVHNAIRMATLNAVGKNGIRLASKDAFAQLERVVEGPKTNGLIREHVVPVSVIARYVESAWASGTTCAWRELKQSLHQDDFDNWEVIDSDAFQDSAAPFSAFIAAHVRDNSLLAWVTARDNARLRDSKLGKSMPESMPGNPRARYIACGIDLVDI